MEQVQSTPERPYLSIDEIADRWGVSRGTVYNAVDAGDLRAKRFGKHIRVYFKEVTRYEEEHDWEKGQYRESPMKGKKMPRKSKRSPNGSAT